MVKNGIVDNLPRLCDKEGVKLQKVADVYAEVSFCTQCPEFVEYHKFAPVCHGNGDRGLMIIGESAHKPSIDAGKYYAHGSMRSLLNGVVDLERDCYLSDAIRCDKQFCSVKGKKTLDKVASRCCGSFLFREIALLQPKVIVAVGRVAFECLTGITGDYVSRQNDGKKYFVKNHCIPVHPVIHPSNANRMYGKVPWQQEDAYTKSVVQIVRSCL